MGARSSAIAVALVLAPAGLARAAEPSSAKDERRIELAYSRNEEAARCPDQSELAGAVSGQLGYDPFHDGSAEKLEVRIVRKGKRWIATLTLKDLKGEVQGTRELDSQGEDCQELAAALALAIAIAIDPLRVAPQPTEPERQPEAPTPEPQPAPAPTAEVPAAPAERPQPKSEPASFVLAGGGLGSVGTAPAPSFGVWVQGALRWPRVSVGLEGRADLPASRDDANGRVSASLLWATAVPCYHAGALFGCALISAGALQGSGEDVDRPRQQTTAFAAIGARAGVGIPLGSRLSLVGRADVLGTLTRTTLRLNGRDAWTTPPLNGAAGLGLSLGFD